MSRSARQLKMIEIVNNNNVETQSELTQLLQEAGYPSTQATISRDIKELGITKIMTPLRRFKYVHGQVEKSISAKFSNLFKESVISIKSAENIVVIKTMIGSANSACAFIDNMENVDVIGSIAGDDTVMLVISSLHAVEKVKNLLNSYLK